MTDQRRRIVLVEDDDDIATLATMALQDIGGFEVTRFSSGEEALAGVDKAKPDVFILDFSMPGMTGGDLLKELKARPQTANVPAIFMTASVMPSHVAELRKLGAIDVFKKPFDPMTLSDQLRATLAKAGC
jgi:CheY-like chemotaxis protein